ncbi:Uncharacterized protein OBRU01_09248 [Operophtera brumata]|uniref:C2H2-type domain-containing protein n=1 Tax=Operophtera brumata TaxID=104452 RepID=A0A0L7LGN8_OPEBR|nr:Uncharacterized protein OBRU01_09248 [Operophtera brumata]
MSPKLHEKYFIPDHYDLLLEHTDITPDHLKLDIDLEIKSLDEELDIKNEDETENEIFVDDFSPKNDENHSLNVSDSEKDIVISDKGFDTDDSLPLEVTRKKKKKKIPLKEKKIKKIKSIEPKIDRRRKPFLNQDLNETLFTITDLTVEEQLAEVLKRQETDNYKHSVFKCTECFKGFLDQDAYTSHMVRHTSECGDHRCDICKTHFKHSHALRKHITAHHLQRFSCNHCTYVTTHRQTARLHERWHKGTKYQCPHYFVCELCGYSFVSAKGIELHKKLKHRGDETAVSISIKVTTYMGHVRIKHPSDFVCELCGYSFVSAKGIELHKKLKHRGDETAVSISIKVTTYMGHVRIKHPSDFVCELCGYSFVSAKGIELHKKLKHRRDETAALRKHTSVSARHAGAERENNKPTRGRKGREQAERWVQAHERCGMQLEDSRAYHGHFRRMHPDKNRTKYPSMKSPCMCEVCGRIFQDHTWVHTGERPFKCEQCGKSFRMKQRLVAHRRVHSAARASYVCAVCGKHFSTHSNRQRHMFIHTGLKPFKCEMCGKGFKHASEKRAHVTYGSPAPPGASEMDIQPVWPACDPKLADINMLDDKPLYYR